MRNILFLYRPFFFRSFRINSQIFSAISLLMQINWKKMSGDQNATRDHAAGVCASHVTDLVLDGVMECGKSLVIHRNAPASKNA